MNERDFALVSTRLDQRAEKILALDQKAEKYWELACDFKAEVGRELIAAKEETYPNGDRALPHGSFEEWVQTKLQKSPEWAQKHMWFGRWFDENRTLGTLLKENRGLAEKGNISGMIAAAKRLSAGETSPDPKESASAAGWKLTGHVPTELWNGEGEPPVAELVAACTDWRVRRG